MSTVRYYITLSAGPEYRQTPAVITGEADLETVEDILLAARRAIEDHGGRVLDSWLRYDAHPGRGDA
jgi:hypothetical protein